MKMNYSYNEMKRAFECGRNFQLTGENNFQELIEELNRALRQPLVMESVCTCTKFRETPMINGKHICSICNKPIVQTDL
jgi:hypothetical protein